MNEQLIVKNFGPIKDATVDFKKVTVFIGPTGGGKSTLAKLAAVLRKKELANTKTDNERHKILNHELADYEISSYARKGSFFHLKADTVDNGYEITASENSISITDINRPLPDLKSFVTQGLQKIIEDRNNKDIDAAEIYALSHILESDFHNVNNQWYSKHFPEILYIPADRVFASAISTSLANLNFHDITLPKNVLSFASDFETARSHVTGMKVDFLNIDYKWINQKSIIQINDVKAIELGASASGIQSTIPMLLVIYSKLYKGSISRNKPSFFFVIEEPELNLYPTSQYGLLNTLISRCTKQNNSLTITTHSPYILASCNLLMEAYKVWQDRPELEAEIEKIVPRVSWINPDDFAAYYVADGTVRSIQDERTDLIGGNELDAVSGQISDAFRSLLRLKKQPA